MMSKVRKVSLGWWGMLANHLMTEEAFFHCCRFVQQKIFVKMLDALLMMPISDLVGLISRAVGLF